MKVEVRLEVPGYPASYLTHCGIEDIEALMNYIRRWGLDVDDQYIDLDLCGSFAAESGHVYFKITANS